MTHRDESAEVGKKLSYGNRKQKKKCGYDQKYLYKVLSGLNTGIE